MAEPSVPATARPGNAHPGPPADPRHRKTAEEEARRQREVLALAQSAARIGSFEWEIQSDVNKWSPGIEGLYGLPPGGFEGTYEGWRRCVHPDDRARAEADVRRSLAEGGPFVSEWRVVLPGGEFRWVEARATVLRDAGGRPERMIGINMDVT